MTASRFYRLNCVSLSLPLLLSLAAAAAYFPQGSSPALSQSHRLSSWWPRCLEFRRKNYAHRNRCGPEITRVGPLFDRS